MELICAMEEKDKLAGIDVYLLEVYQNRYTGFDTFRNEFLEGMLQYKELNLHVVVEEYPTDSIYAEVKRNITYIYFPKINGNKFMTLESFFRLAIKKTARMVFMSNFCPIIFNVKAIKKIFPNAKVLHVIHDFPWLSTFKGDETAYVNFILGNGNGELTVQDDKFVRYCTYDLLESFELMDRIVCLCKSTYKILLDFYNISIEKVCLIPNGIADYMTPFQSDEFLRIRKKFGVPNDGIIVLLSGRLTYSKGADRIYEYLSRISRLKKFYLMYMGQDDMNEWLPSNYSFPIIPLGFLNLQEKHEIYSITDLGLFPSRFEQCSYVGIEYLMHGIPVLFTPSYGIRDMFDCHNAFSLNDTNPITLKAVIDKREIARESYLKNYTRKRMVDKYTSLIFKMFAINKCN